MKKEGSSLKKLYQSDRCNIQCERYEQQISYILEILGEVREELKYALIWDDTSFGDLSVTPQELTLLSNAINLPVTSATPVIECAVFMHANNLDSGKLS